MTAALGPDPSMGASDAELERQLQELLAGLPDEDVHELAALAEAMHAEAEAN